MLIATRSPHKLAEIREILGDLPLRFLSLAELGVDPRPEEEEIERHDSFRDNAVAKARYFHARVGLPAVADDSGLCVDALGGGPGVRTKRFAPRRLVARFGLDEANNRWLLERLEGVPPAGRAAEYRCAIAAVGGPERSREAQEAFVSEGRVAGRIARAPRGEGGFGYDPLFVFPPRGRTFAELPPEVKREHGHRARAVQGLRPWLEALWEEAPG